MLAGNESLAEGQEGCGGNEGMLRSVASWEAEKNADTKRDFLKSRVLTNLSETYPTIYRCTLASPYLHGSREEVGC